MFYMMALDIMLLVCMAISFNAFRMMAKREMSQGVALATTASVMLPAMLLGAPLMLEVVRVTQFHNGGVSLDGAAVQNWLTAGGAIVGALVFGRRLWAMRSTGAGFWRVGGSTMGLLISVYMGFVSADQYAFYQGKEDAGLLNWEFMREIGSVKDVHCESELMAVSGVNGEKAVFRCPTHVVLGKFTGQPFIPWPGYTQGESKELASAIKKMHAEAISTEKR